MEIDRPNDKYLEIKIQVSEKAAGQLGAMMAETNLDRREIMNLALTLLDKYFDAIRNGREVGEIDETNKRFRVWELGDLKKRIKPHNNPDSSQ